jgi:MAGUK p55 subfamily protein 5
MLATELLLGLISRLEPKFHGNLNDLKFLRHFLQSNEFRNLLEIHDKVRDASSAPLTMPSKFLTTTHMVLYDLENHQSSESQELYKLLTSPCIHSIILAHDKIANKDYPPVLTNPDEMKKFDEDLTMFVRVDKEDEPLGATVKSDTAGNILISRVIHGSVADRCGLLRAGDVIHEINGESVHDRSIDEIADRMSNLRGTIVFKISPSQENCLPKKRHRVNIELIDKFTLSLYDQSITYVKALFSYNPKEDSYLPCSEAGLSFNKGDILAILNKDDPHWWQASDGSTKIGLIPSSLIRERMEYRNVIFESASKAMRTKKKREVEYSPLNCEEQGGTELVTYEEVIRMEPQVLHPRPIILMGPQCEPFDLIELKSKLIQSSPYKIGSPVMYTTMLPKEDEVDGEDFHFVTKEDFFRQADNDMFVDHFETRGIHFGVSIIAIKKVMFAGKTCLLTLSPKVLKYVHYYADIKPYVVYFTVPPRGTLPIEPLWSSLDDRSLQQAIQQDKELKEHYGQYFDEEIEYTDLDYAVVQVQRNIDKLRSEPQWVPATWTA